jgi:hypothetical protein
VLVSHVAPDSLCPVVLPSESAGDERRRFVSPDGIFVVVLVTLH